MCLMRKEWESVRYELLRPDEVAEIRSRTPIAYIVLGSLEWHGYQNPLGTDSLKAHAICCEAALRRGGIVLPPFYQGLLGEEGWGPEGWEGYTLGGNTPEMLAQAMTGVAKALVFGGWKVIVGVTGHDVAPQRDTVGRAIAAETDGVRTTGFAVLEGELHAADDDLPYKMDHAGAWETSCMMYVHPDRVDLEALSRRGLATADRMEMSGPEGIGGWNPLKFASAELGSRIVTRMADLISAKAAKMLADLDPSGNT
jgi:creatinine amidohydrolase